MPSKIVNLTFQLVTREVEDILVDYPEYPYQAAFAIPYLRQKLIAHILNHIRNRYTVIEDTEELTKDVYLLAHLLADRECIETLIRRSIIKILQENADWINRQIPQKDKSISQEENLVNQPSHWFG